MRRIGVVFVAALRARHSDAHSAEIYSKIAARTCAEILIKNAGADGAHPVDAVAADASAERRSCVFS